MQVARERYNRTLDPGPFGIDSRPALIGAKFAEQQGAGPAYHDGVMRAYWQEARDISDRAVLAEIAAAAGMERAAFIAALDDPAFETSCAASSTRSPPNDPTPGRSDIERG